jgi:hypothetical protein
MRTGRPKQPLILTEDEQDRLQSLDHRARRQSRLARRARVVLACAEGLDHQTVAKKLRGSLERHGWQVAFLLPANAAGRTLRRTTPGAPRQITDAPVEQVVIQTLPSRPRGQTHGSTRGWAQATGLSRMTIRRIGHAFGWQPNGSETFKWSPDPQLIEKVCDLVGLYRNPPDHALLLCVDENSQI